MKKIVLYLALAGFVLKSDAQTNPPAFGAWGHGPAISNAIIKNMPAIRGWNFTFAWKDIEPQKGRFNWKLMDDQFKIAADNNLYIGFMIWVGQNSPEWVYTQDGVEKVVTKDDKHSFPYFPYYMNPAYKADYFNLMHQVVEHIKTISPHVQQRMLFWMSAEGTTGDESPYKGTTENPKFEIPEEKWTAFKQEAWTYMYNAGQSLTPKLNILINQANDGRYFDWLMANLSGAWFKAGSLGHTYQFSREQEYTERMARVVRPDNNGMVNRFRSESEEIQELGWFKQSPPQNTFALVASSLHMGLDMLNIRKDIVRESWGTFPFDFFNRYAGQRDPATATGAFCVLRDVLDAADTKRFPESEYGKLDPGTARGLRQLRDVPQARIDKILAAFKSQGAQNGPSPELEVRLYKDDAKLPAKLRKNNLRPDLVDKYNSDMGIYLIPDNYSKFLTQYSPNTTSKGYWRVGPADQPYGRYARAFDHAAGMKEMLFALDSHFFSDNSKPHPIKMEVTYFDEGNGEWALTYFDGKQIKNAYRIKCTNAGKWITKSIMLNDVMTNQKMPHNTDFSLKYLSGTDTKFSLLELSRE